MQRSVILALALGLAVTAAGCGGDSSSSKKSDCQKLCDAWAAAKCSGDDLTTCVTDCNDSVAVTTCQAEFKALVACAGKVSWACDPTDHTGYPNGCVTETVAYVNCLP
jgi:hypothetical protein